MFEGDVGMVQQCWFDLGGSIDGFEFVLLEKVDVVIDVFFGMGINSYICNEFVDVIDVVNVLVIFVVSVDVFFGLDVNIGQSLGWCVQVDVMVIFVGIKLGFVIGVGKQFCGKLVYVDLGIGKVFQVFVKVSVIMFNIEYFKGMGLCDINSYKGIYGRLLCIGGNCGIVGVICLVSEVVL